MSLSLIFDIMTILNSYKVVHSLMYIQVNIVMSRKINFKFYNIEVV